MRMALWRSGTESKSTLCILRGGMSYFARRYQCTILRTSGVTSNCRCDIILRFHMRELAPTYRLVWAISHAINPRGGIQDRLYRSVGAPYWSPIAPGASPAFTATPQTTSDDVIRQTLAGYNARACSYSIHCPSLSPSLTSQVPPQSTLP